MTDMIYLGEDLGMGANKLYGEGGGTQTLAQVSVHAEAFAVDGLGLKSVKRPTVIGTDHGSFYVGANAHQFGRPVEALDFDRLTGTPEMRALFYGSLTQYQLEHGRFEGPLSLLVGLPLAMMKANDSDDYKGRVKKWIKGTHVWTADGEPYQVEVADVKLAPQALGALFDYALDDDGRALPGNSVVLQGEVGVVSVGFNTVELMVISNRQNVERFAGGNALGVRRLLELLDPDQNYTLGELDMKLRSGALNPKRELDTWARDVEGDINRRWGTSFKRFERVLLVGGGAVLLQDHLVGMFKGKGVVLPEPVEAISRGLFKMAIRARK